MENNAKPTLVVMAAGMGSRYGGMKQIEAMDEQGHIIMDFSIYDALLAGFGKVVFIIKRENEALFKEVIGDRVAAKVPVSYVFQELTNLPEGYSVPEGRQKPWGTGHAILSCLDVVNEPFVAINADDFYGRQAFALAADFLKTAQPSGEKAHYMMVGYRLENTLTENGHVARGVCETDDKGYLLSVHERSKIMRRGEGAAYTEDEVNWVDIPLDETVSMNMWGFTPDFLQELKKRFPAFLEENLEKNPLKCEYFLPFVVDAMIQAGEADVKVLTTPDKWFGVTYKEDKPMVVQSIRAMEEAGVYPEKF